MVKMLYELRTYEATVGNMGALVKHLEVAAGLFRKHGLEAPGFWTDEIGMGNRVTYMWKYEDVAERNVKLAAFSSDPAWTEQVAEETRKYGPITSRTHNTIMQPTAYSPVPDFSVNNVHELRTYHAAPGKLPALNQRFANHSDRLLRKHGMNVVGYWTDMVGTSGRLIWMVGYDSLAHREQCWDSFGTDDEWPKVRDESIKDGELVSRAENIMLKPTAFSRP